MLQCSSDTHSLSSPSAPEDDDEKGRAYRQTPQQPAALWWALSCCSPNGVVHTYKGGPRGKVSEAPHITTAPLFLAFLVVFREDYRTACDGD